VSALLDPDSLFIPLALPNSETMCTLIDSGSSHCFVDSSFVSNHKITTTTIPSIGLRLFDGTCNSVITQTAELPISFPNGTEFNLTFYVTSLDSSCSAVLGFNWLYKYNLLIDWFTGTITFRTTEQRGQALSMSSGEAAMLQEPPPAPNSPTKHLNLEPIPPSTPPTSPRTSNTPPHISMINAAAYLRTCRLPGSQSFQLSLSKEGIFANSVAKSDAPDLTNIPEEYCLYIWTLLLSYQGHMATAW